MPLDGCVALRAHADYVPLLGAQETPAVTGALARKGETLPSVDGPAKTAVPPPSREGRRLPDDQDAFHRSDLERSRGSLLPPSRAGLPLTPPTLCPQAGESAFSGIASALAGVSRRELREYGRLCQPVGEPCLELTTQARQRGPDGEVDRGGLVAYRSCLRRPQRPYGFYDREFPARDRKSTRLNSSH